MLLLSVWTAQIFAEERNILLFTTNPSQFPWVQELNRGIQAELSSRPDWKMYVESMDAPRLGAVLDDEQWIEYLENKYGNLSMDAVLAEGGPASRFINSHGPALLGNIPMVIHSYESLPQHSRAYYFKNQQDQALLDTLRLAVEENPNSKELIIINASGRVYRENRTKFTHLAEELGLGLTEIRNFTLESLLKQIGNLRGDELLLYFLVFSDESGERYNPREVLSHITEVSPAPVYSLWSTLMGTGLVGGVMVNSHTIGREMIRALDDYFSTGEFKDVYSSLQAQIDWNAARRHRIDLKSDTTAVDIINAPPPLLEYYGTQIFGVSVLILVLVLALALFSRYQILQSNMRLENEIEKGERLLRQREILQKDLVEAKKLSSLGMMVAGVAHELNTPIGSAILAGSSLQHDLEKLSSAMENISDNYPLYKFMEKAANSLEVITSSHEKASSLIESFKRLAFERSNEQIWSFSLFQLVSDLKKTLNPRLKKSRVSIRMHIPENLMLYSYYGPLSQVLQNLILNALEHAFPDDFRDEREITISANQSQGPSGETVEIDVTDTGKGVDPDIQEKMYDPFITSSRGAGHTGLGLHFVHLWVFTVLKGKIGVRSTPGEGTSFLITIPAVLNPGEESVMQQ